MPTGAPGLPGEVDQHPDGRDNHGRRDSNVLAGSVASVPKCQMALLRWQINFPPPQAQLF